MKTKNEKWSLLTLDFINNNEKIIDTIINIDIIIKELKEENKKLKTEIECNNEVIEQLTINK